MAMKIAALTCGGALSAVEHCTEALLFEKKGGAWLLSQLLPFQLEGSSSSEIRDCVRSLILELDCSVVVAKSVTGIAYHVFDRMGFSVFEAETLSDALLDGLLLDVEQARKQRSKEQAATEPVPLDEEGQWFLDLIALKEAHPEISSKQALRPFLQKKTFLKLKLLCTHLPPWLDVELPARHLSYTMEAQPDGRLMVSIARALCKE